MLKYAFYLAIVMTLTEESILVTWQGECNYGGESYPCEKYTFKDQEYGVMWKEDEIYRIDRIHPDGTIQNLYLAPTRYWT